MTWYDRVFATAPEAATVDLAAAHEVLFAAEAPYVKRLLEWLEDEALKPLPTANANDTVAAAAKRNAYIEVRTKIRTDARRAAEALANAREDPNA